MNSEGATSIRQAYKDQTRERILDAAIDEMNERRAEELTIAQVAARAGVTERTVYRHFSTRDMLIEAVWPRIQKRVGSSGFPKTAEALIATPLWLFPQFDEQKGLVTATIRSGAGHEIRMRVNEDRQASMLACVADALPDIPPDMRRRRAAIAQLIDSAYGWSVLGKYWDLDGEEAGKAAAEAIAVLLGLAKADDTSIDLTPYRREKP